MCSFDIENTIHTLPGVVEAVVVGVPDSKYMEVPAAVIKLEKGTNVRAEDIKEMLKTRVARFKIPEYIVFVEDIPKTHNGKIDKRMIKRVDEKYNGRESGNFRCEIENRVFMGGQPEIDIVSGCPPINYIY